MKIKNPAIAETLRISVGMILCLGLMLGVFALLDKFSVPVLIGGVVGTLVAVGNFFFMAIGLSNLADDATEGHIRIRTQSSFMVRTIFMVAILGVAIYFGKCDPVATILPLLFIRPILTVEQFVLKSSAPVVPIKADTEMREEGEENSEEKEEETHGA